MSRHAIVCAWVRDKAKGGMEIVQYEWEKAERDKEAWRQRGREPHGLVHGGREDESGAVVIDATGPCDVQDVCRVTLVHHQRLLNKDGVVV